MVRQGKHPVPSWIQRGKLRWVWGLWEPLRLYRRSAHMAAYSPGNAHWAEDWYLRMHSEEMVGKLADLGINCLSTHFFKGFGAVAEAEEMDRAAEFTELCHAHGIRVLGYCQWATICYETFLDEVPHARDWVQRDAAGDLLLYGSSTYWRWLGCQRHHGYVAYLEDVVRRCIGDVGMDGVEWDGTVYKCHCELCHQAFRDYLAETYDSPQAEELFGLPHFRHVRIPTTESRRDPLFLALLDYRRDFMVQRLAGFNDLIKSINPEAAQVTYDMDAGPWGPTPDIDLLVDENHDHSFVDDAGVLTTKFRGLKHAFALDRVVLSTGWLRAPSRSTSGRGDSFETAAEIAAFGAPVGGLRRPETPAEVTRDLAECAMYGGHMITPTWATRSSGGDRAAFEQVDLHSALRRYLHFFRDHEALYDVDESLATIAVYRGAHALTCDFFSAFPCVFGIEQVCLQYRFPFDMLFTFQLDRLPSYSAVVLAEQTCLSDREVEAFKAYARSGGGLVVTGRTGLYDERGRHRCTHPLNEIFELPRVVFFPDAPERLSVPKRDHPPAYHDMHLPPRADELAKGILTAAPGQIPCTLEAGPYVAMEVYRSRGGERIIHLLNYDNETPLGSVSLRLGPTLSADTVRVLSPDWDLPEMIAATSCGCVEFGPFETYAVVVLPASECQ